MPTAIVVHFTAPDDLDGPEVDAATEALIAEGAALGLSFDGAIASPEHVVKRMFADRMFDVMAEKMEEKR